jgi:hypothetical protein
MKMFGVVAALCGVLLVAPPAQAQTAADRLGQCLVEHSTPKDQATLVRWMFSALIANPSLKSLASLTPEQRAEIDKAMATLFERLLMDDCRPQTVAAMKEGNTDAVGKAFEVLGERAAEQLLSDPGSAKELQKMAEHLDAAKWQQLMKEAGK